ncbi:hypothetical protein ACHAPJ_006074 [Fusarium lateritium]
MKPFEEIVVSGEEAFRIVEQHEDVELLPEIVLSEDVEALAIGPFEVIGLPEEEPYEDGEQLGEVEPREKAEPLEVVPLKDFVSLAMELLQEVDSSETELFEEWIQLSGYPVTMVRTA